MYIVLSQGIGAEAQIVAVTSKLPDAQKAAQGDALERGGGLIPSWFVHGDDVEWKMTGRAQDGGARYYTIHEWPRKVTTRE